MVVEVRGDYVGAFFIGGVLNRREVVHVHIARDNHNAAGVLTGGGLDAFAALSEAGDVSFIFFEIFFFEEFSDVAHGGFFGDSHDCAGAVNVVLSEKNFGVLVRGGLVFAGKIQVDVWNFVAVEAEENCSPSFSSG